MSNKLKRELNIDESIKLLLTSFSRCYYILHFEFGCFLGFHNRFRVRIGTPFLDSEIPMSNVIWLQLGCAITTAR